MRAGVVATERRRGQNFAQPVQIFLVREALWDALRPATAESVDFVPALLPVELAENPFRPPQKFRKRRDRWQKLDPFHCTRDVRVLFGARADFAENLDIIDEYVAVRVTQFFFDSKNRCLIENPCVNSANELQKKF